MIKAKVSFEDVPETIGSTLRLRSPALIALTADKITPSLGEVSSEIILGGFGLDFARRRFGCESNTPLAFSAAGKYPNSLNSLITSVSSRSVTKLG